MTNEVSAAKGQAERAEHKNRKKILQQEIFRLERELSAAKNRRRPTLEHRERIQRKRRELSQIEQEFRAAKGQAERAELKKRKESIRQEILQLKRELRAAREQQAEEEPATGALPDFAIIGAMKGGTTYLYHLLTQHPYVQHAAAKELHYFDILFDEGTEWYRRCFPTPKWKDGRRAITGEATPYLPNLLAPERMAKVVPQARLIALLRNPVDRTYSHYQQALRKSRETLRFEEAVEEAIRQQEARSLGEEDEASEHEGLAGLLDGSRRGYVSKSIYVDQLQPWSGFFSKEQMLVLKSEDFFEHPQEILERVFGFLDLPDWEPEASQIAPKKRNKGRYEEGMDSATRRRLEEYFEPHNQRLYDYLGIDFGW